MKVTLTGATGNAGSRILAELLERGHLVTALVRNPAKLAPSAGLTVLTSDLSSAPQIADCLSGTEAAISAFAPPRDNTDLLVSTTARIAEAAALAATPRLLVVGGAGNLTVAPGLTLLDSGYLPAEWLDIAKAHSRTLDFLKTTSIDWTYFSPAGFFEPGSRTGQFRLGTTALITDEQGESRISMEDYAIAMVDELENPKHHRAQFCIGY